MEKIPGPGQIKAGVEGATGALLGNIESGEGIIKVVRRLGGPEMAQFGTAGGPGMGALAQNSKLLNLIGQAMISPKGPAALQQAIATNANPAQLFVAGSRSGTAKVGEELFGLNKGPFNEALSGLIDSEINPLKSVPADTVKNKFLTGLGTFLGPVLKFLGLSLLIAALASFTMRQKGKGKMGGSRMSRLKGIVDEMTDVPCGEDEKCPDGSEPPCEDDPPPPPPGECSDEEKEQGKVWNPDTEECECPEGQTFNDETGKCEPGGEEDPCKDKPGTTWNPETEECEDDEEVEEQIVEKPILLRYDDDHVKVYAPRLPNTEAQEGFLSAMEKAQSDALLGRVDLEETLAGIVSDVLLEMSDEMGTEKAELDLGTRGFRWDTDKWGALTAGKLNRKYKRTSKKKNKEGEVVKIKRIIPKYFYVFDKSLESVLEQVDIDENTVRMLAKWMIKMLRKGNKATLSGREIKKLVTTLAGSAKNIEGKEQEIINAISNFSVVKDSKRIREVDQQPDFSSINEAKELARMKVLSGIK